MVLLCRVCLAATRCCGQRHQGCGIHILRWQPVYVCCGVFLALLAYVVNLVMFHFDHSCCSVEQVPYGVHFLSCGLDMKPLVRMLVTSVEALEM